MSVLPARNDASEERAWANAGRAEHRRNTRRLMRLAKRITALLPSRNTVDTAAQDILWFRVLPEDPITDELLADLAKSVTDHAGNYVELPLPIAVEHAVRYGPVRIIRYFNPDKRSFVTDIAVGFDR